MRFSKTDRCQPNRHGRFLRLEPLEDRRLLTIFAPTNGAQLAADIVTAESTGGTNTINLGAHTYTLPSAPNVPGHGGTLTISGLGASASIVQGDGSARVFDFVNQTVCLKGLTIEDGLAKTGGPGSVGSGARGGGLFIDGGRVTLSGCVVKSNRAAGAAGFDGMPDINGTNGAAASGGGIFLLAGTLNICNSTISANTAQGGAGGKGGQGAAGADGSAGNKGSAGKVGTAGRNGTASSRNGGSGQPGKTGGDGGSGIVPGFGINGGYGG